MKRRRGTSLFFGVWLLGLTFILSCDTADNVDDPDVHYFIKFFGGDGDQSGVDMLALSDGSVLILGNNAPSNLQSNVMALRISSDGEVIWQQNFGDGFAVAIDIEPTLDGNFVILSDYIAPDADSFDLQLMKISPDGELLASTSVGTRANDKGRTVTPISDGSFIVSGTTELTPTWSNPNDPDPDPGDIISYRFDANLTIFGPTEWSPTNFGWGSNLDVAVKVTEKPGKPANAFYTFGYTSSAFSGYNENERSGLFYFERDSTGSMGSVFFTQLTVEANDTEIHFVQPVGQELGGGILAIGTSINNLNVSEVFLAKLRSTLTFESLDKDATMYKNIPIGRNVRGVSATGSVVGEYGFLILGNEVRSTGNVNFWITKIDQSGSIIWSATYGSEGKDDFAASLVELPDGKIMMLGTMGMADNQSKMALIKMNPRGQLLR